MRGSFITVCLLLSVSTAAVLGQTWTENDALLIASVRAEEAMVSSADGDFGGEIDAYASGMAHALTMDYGFKDRKMPQIVFFGDSITNFGFTNGDAEAARVLKVAPDYKGWVVTLNETLQQQAFLHNLAFKAGTNTKGFNLSTPVWQEQIKTVAQDVALVNIAFGANDAVLSCGWYSSPGDYLAVLRKAILGLREAGVKNIMLTTPPPVGLRHPEGPDRVNELTAYYAKAVHRLARSVKVPVANIYDPMMAVEDWRTKVLTQDQLHLTNQGNQMVHDIVWETIQRNFPDVSATGLPAFYKKQHAASLQQEALVTSDKPQP